jgi:hypothetical protein
MGGRYWDRTSDLSGANGRDRKPLLPRSSQGGHDPPTRPPLRSRAGSTVKRVRDRVGGNSAGSPLLPLLLADESALQRAVGSLYVSGSCNPWLDPVGQ